MAGLGRFTWIQNSRRHKNARQRISESYKASKNSEKSAEETSEKSGIYEIRDPNFEQRWRLYLPRNLSNCMFCAAEIEKHVRQKTRLLEKFLKRYHPELLLDPFQLKNIKEEEKIQNEENKNDVSFFLPVKQRRASQGSGSSGLGSSPTSSDAIFSSSDEESDWDSELESELRNARKVTSDPFILTGEPKNGQNDSAVIISNRDSKNLKSAISRGRSKTWHCKQTYDSCLLTEKSDKKRKCVQFADAYGLELEYIRTFFASDFPAHCADRNQPTAAAASPQNKRSALASSRNGSKNNIYRNARDKFPVKSSSFPLGSQSRMNKRLEPCFPLDSVLTENRSDLSKWVALTKVVLVHNESLSVSGEIRVKNLAYHKHVWLRYSLDDWVSFHDHPCHYVYNDDKWSTVASNAQGMSKDTERNEDAWDEKKGGRDGEFDIFGFNIFLPRTFAADKTLEFSVKYEVNGAAHWDNFGGKNYSFKCFGNLGHVNQPNLDLSMTRRIPLHGYLHVL